MKKFILLFIVNFIFTLKIIACSYTPTSFCATSESFSENLIVFGKIISIDNKGIDFEIINVLKGEENKTVIRIWNGVDFDCNGNWSMSASELGELNETIVIILPKILEKKSDWEIVGEYRRPDFFGYTPNLKVENGIISGLIYGNVSYPYVEEQANYENFKNSWETNQNCSTVVLGTKNYESEETFKILTLSNNKFKISSNKNAEFKIIIFNINGLKIESNELVKKEFEIDLSKYSAGIYFINLTYENNKIHNFKIIKK
tara:strand:- start:168 stop:944 length:777 start_codon:yes stop_codon:yes gene_type:complete